MHVACVQISSVEQACITWYGLLSVLLNNGAYLSFCWNTTLEIQIYITKEHHFPIFVTFEITRNNKCMVYSFQEKYQLVCSSILSYIWIHHIFLKYINCSNHYSNILFKNCTKIYSVWYRLICSGQMLSLVLFWNILGQVLSSSNKNTPETSRVCSYMIIQ